jgi:hypothetical protein
METPKSNTMKNRIVRKQKTNPQSKQTPQFNTEYPKFPKLRKVKKIFWLRQNPKHKTHSVKTNLYHNGHEGHYGHNGKLTFEKIKHKPTT